MVDEGDAGSLGHHPRKTISAAINKDEGDAGGLGQNGYHVTIRTMAGESTELPRLQGTDTVFDLARSVRSNVGVPISVQHLAWGTVALKEPHMRLDALFKDSGSVEVTLLRRPFSPVERAQLHRRLVQATIAGEFAQVRELLREGAQVNFETATNGDDVSLTLKHWEDNPEFSTELLPRAFYSSSQADPPTSEPADDDDNNDDDDDDADDESGTEEDSASGAEDNGNRTDDGAFHPCGGLSPLLVALVAGHGELANDFRQLGASEVSITPSATSSIKEAFARKDFPEVAKHMAQGADLNILMARGRLAGALDVWSMWPGSEPMFATPLHACVAMHTLPGAYETAQLLIKLGADLNAGDAQGDSPLAHTRYFRANEMYELYLHEGAKLVVTSRMA